MFGGCRLSDRLGQRSLPAPFRGRCFDGGDAFGFYLYFPSQYNCGATCDVELLVISTIFGIALSMFQVSQAAIWPHYFGGANLGKIRGLALPIGLSLSAVSAPLTGLLRDNTGEFDIAWIVAAIGLALGTVILLLTPRPAPPRRDAEQTAGTEA